MADELVIDNQPTIVDEYDSFDGSPTPPEERVAKLPETPIIEPIKVENVIPEIPVVADVPIEDGRSYLKEKLGYDDWDAVKNEIETLKNKTQTPAEFKLEELETTKIKELYAVIEKKEKLDQLTTGEVTVANAPDIIKAAMIEKYKGLSAEMVTHKFNKLFSAPLKPKEENFSDTEEFDEATKVWKEKVSDIEMEMLIEANLVRPDLEKIKSEIKLPEIKKVDPLDVPFTPEELAKDQKEKESFLQFAGEALKKFEGFNVTYKNNDVDVQSTYTLSEEEKTSVFSKMKLLAEKNYNSNAVFAERWVNADLSFNYNQMAKDLATLESAEKSSQKFASDVAAKVKEQYIKAKHNTDLGNNSVGELQLEDKTTQQKTEEAIWS